MDSSIDAPPNPFLSNSLNSLCIACNRNLENRQTVSIHENLPQIQPAISLFEGLKLLSDFSKFSIEQVPPRGCKACFDNTSGFLRFQRFCYRSVSNLEHYISHHEDTKLSIIRDNLIQSAGGVETSDACEDTADTSAQSVGSDSNLVDMKVEVETPELIISNDSNVSNSNEEVILTRSEILQRRKDKRKERVECKHCHKLFARAYIKYHEQIHIGGANYKCDTCNKSFVNPNNYHSHMHNMHKYAKVRPFLCSQCGRGFKRGWHLQHHIRVEHNHERPYKCKICDKTFKLYSTLRGHASMHSDERPFQCEKCPKRFSLRKFLKQHSVTHEELRPIACEFCDKRFTQRHCLRSHQAKTCEGLHNRTEN